MEIKELCQKAEILTQNPSYGNLAGLVQEICLSLVKLEKDIECSNAKPVKKKINI